MPELVSIHDGNEVPLPSLKLDMRARIQGDLASVILSQTFQNTHTTPIHARYTFPLPPDAAVHAMRFIVGDQMIEAEIREKKEARAVFEAARTRGNQAALVEQHRPNVFTQEVANLMPGAIVRVELEYAHVVEKQHGAYRFHFPMVVGPRFIPAASSRGSRGAPTRATGEPLSLAVGVWNLPASSPVAPPERVDRDRVSVHIELDGGMPIRFLESPSHTIKVEKKGRERRSVQLGRGRTLDNQDFELHYRLADDDISAGVTTYTAGGDGYLSLLFEPPTSVADEDISRREMVFVLDCSGSMSGVPLAASKRFMRKALSNLRPGDTFRIIRFSDSATTWSESPMPATAGNIRNGIQYIDSLFGSGGTHMVSGIRAALAPAVPEDALRLVVFLTDGYIGNDVEIVRLIEARRGDARLFSFGIGNSVNRYLIQEMGRVGRGASRMVRPDDDAERAADEWVARLDAPVLTDIEIDWGEAAVRDVFPRAIPDLFMGQTLRVMARYDQPGEHRAVIHGRIAGKPVSLPLDLELPAHDDGVAGQAVPIIWARSQIEDRMIEFISPAVDQDRRDSLQREVTSLGLEHRLLTQWTSFVAVAREVVNPGGRGASVDVEVPQAEDVSEAAYPPEALSKGGRGAELTPAPQSFSGGMQLVAQSGFSGASGPEPSTWLALLAIGLVAAVLWWRRAAAHS
jgi:Ca-activated chloride channel family protein